MRRRRRLGLEYLSALSRMGGVEARAAFVLDIPPIAQSAASYRIGLDNFGIENLTFDITVRVA
jgi:hypothetical protein